MRVYLVEDSPIMLRLLRELLTSVGIQVVGHSGNAAAATSEINTLLPDVIVIDISLESGNGFDVLNALAPKKGATKPLCIVLTNHLHAPLKAAAARIGVVHYFDKSADISKMISLLAAMQEAVPKLGNGTEP